MNRPGYLINIALLWHQILSCWHPVRIEFTTIDLQVDPVDHYIIMGRTIDDHYSFHGIIGSRRPVRIIGLELVICGAHFLTITFYSFRSWSRRFSDPRIILLPLLSSELPPTRIFSFFFIIGCTQ